MGAPERPNDRFQLAPAEHEHRNVCQQQAGRPAELRPRGDEAAVLVGPCPLHREQHRAAPLAADADALDEADDGEDHGTPDSDRLISGDDADRRGGKPGQQQCRDQRRLAADAVATQARPLSDMPVGASDFCFRRWT